MYNQIEVICMLKKFWFQMLLAICIGGAGGAVIGNYINEKANYREFEFRGGIKHAGGGYVRSTCHVLINEKDYDLEEMFDKVYDEYVLMNGESDELTLYFYDTKYQLDASDPVASKSYVKD